MNALITDFTDFSDFDLHDPRDFPLLRFRPERALPGYAAQWQREMEILLALGQAFVILMGTGHHEESHADRKARALWLKANKTLLARLCLGLGSVEADAGRREQLRAMAEGSERAFGVRHFIAASVAEVEAQLLAALRAATCDKHDAGFLPAQE